MIAFVLGLVLAPAAASSPPPEVAEEAVPGRDPRAAIDEAIALRRKGDAEGARALLVELEPLIPEELTAWYLYQRGVCEEMAWRPDAARAFYDQVVALGTPESVDARFRRALVLEDMGQDAAALLDVLALAKVKGLDEDDEVTLALQRGITEVNTGKVRKGVKRIDAALAKVEAGDTHRYMRAKARYTLARALLAEADGLRLDGPEKRGRRNNEQRARRVKAAEEQIVALVALNEPEWILASLVALGDSYVRWADDLEASPTPRKLSATQALIYREQVGKYVANARTKAFHAYDQGVSLATRLGWESPRVATLKERRKGLEGVR
ncbi:MAG: hypothetical protein ACOZNI_02695 [Myxococcota bacterium]